MQPAAGLPPPPFTNQSLARHGFPKSWLAGALSSGLLRRPLRGVYVPADWPDDPTHRALAAAAVLRPDQVLVDRTAAWLHGIDAYGFGELEALPPVETAVLTRMRATRADGTRGRSRDLADADIAVMGATRLTTPLRTALDVACNLRRAEALACLDGFVRAGLVTPTELAGSLGRFRGRRGVVQARQLVGLVDGRAESARESRMRLAIADAGLEHPTPQVEVVVDGHWFRLDLGYRARRIGIEYDGQEFHDSREQVEHDRWRRGLLESAGWNLIVVRNGDFVAPRLDRWIDELRLLLEGTYTTLRW